MECDGCKGDVSGLHRIGTGDWYCSDCEDKWRRKLRKYEDERDKKA